MTDRQPTRADVRGTFERIGAHFAKTRQYAWPEVATFVETHRGRRGLDLGCGNGRHTELLAERSEQVVGLDASRTLLGVARERATERGYAASTAFIQGDAVALPFAADRFDVAAYVATLHHLPTAADRRASLRELARVLAPDGRALVSAWSVTDERFDRTESFDATIDWTLPDGETVPRFYHIYASGEFRADLAASGLETVSFDVSSGNCYATVRAAR